MTVCAVTIGLLSLDGRALLAQRPGSRLIRWSPSATEVGFQFDGDRSSYVDTSRGGRMLQSSYRTWIRLPINGALFRPGVLSYYVVMRPQLQQQRVTGVDRPYVARYTGFDLGMNLFEGLPFGLTYGASRTASSLAGGTSSDGRFGTRTDAGTLRLQIPAFPMQLHFGSRSTDDFWQGGPTIPATRRNERLRSLEFYGQSSKTTLAVNRNVFLDRVGLLSFSSVEGDLTHIHRWGRGSSFQTALSVGDRVGNTAFHRVSWTERVRLRHAESHTSDVFFIRRRSVTEGFLTNGYSVGGMTRYRVTGWLDASLTGHRQVDRYSKGDLDVSALSPRLGLHFLLPRGMKLNGDLSLSVEHERRSFGDETLLPVLDEPHRAVEGPRGFPLAQLDADSTSIDVTRADRTFRFVRDIDYLVVVEGRETRIVLIPGGRIVAGEGLAVSYRRRLALGLDQRILGEIVDVGLIMDGLSLRHVTATRHVTSDDPRGPGLLGGREHATTIGFRRNLRIGAAEVHAEHRVRAQALTFTSDELRFSLLPPSGSTLQTSVGAAATRSRSERRSGDAFSARGTVNWSPRSTLRLQTSLEWWLWRYADARPDRIVGGNAELDWRLGRVETEARYSYQRRTTLLTGMQHRLMVRVLRRF